MTDPISLAPILAPEDRPAPLFADPDLTHEERYDAFVWCDEATALHPLPALPTPGEMETYPAGV